MSNQYILSKEILQVFLGKRLAKLQVWNEKALRLEERYLKISKLS